MTENHDTAAATPTPTRRWRRRGTRGSLIALAVIIVLVVLISVAPTYVARHYLSKTLETYGIQSEGVDTLGVNLWKGKAYLGPVGFRESDRDFGRLAKLDVELNLLALFEKHAFIESVIVDGIDIVLTRSEDGALAINGIDFDQFASQASTPSESGEAPADDPWGFGLTDLVLKDSRLLYRDADGGRLTVEVEALRLDDLLSWQPTEEGHFDLQARLNDMALDWSGTLRPFAPDIALTVDGTLSGVELARITDFTGDLGLERQAGMLDADLDVALTFKADGGIDGGAVGELEMSGADYALPEGFSMAFPRGHADLDLRFTRSTQGGVDLGGRFEAELTELQSRPADDQSLAVQSLSVDLGDLEVAVGEDSSLSISVLPDVKAETVGFSGPVHISMDAVLSALQALQALSAVEPVNAEQTGLSDWSGGEATLPRSDVKVDSLQASASVFELKTSGGEVSLNLSSSIDLSGVEVESSGRNTSIDTLHNELKELKLNSGGGRLSLSLAGENAAQGGRAQGPLGILGFDTLRSTIDSLALDVEHGRISTRTRAAARLDAATLQLFATEDLPAASANLGLAAITLHEGEFAQTGRDLSWRALAEASVENGEMDYGKGEFSTAKVASLKVKGAQADQNLNLALDELTLGGLDVVLTRRFINGLGASAEDDADTQAAPTAELVAEIQGLLAELGYDPGPVDGRLGGKTRAAIRAFEEASGMPVTGQASEDLLAALQDARSGKREPPAFELKIGRIALLDKAHIGFTDETVSPTVKIDTVIDTLQLSDVDTTRPETVAHAELLAHINEFTRIALDGTASDLGAKADLQAKGSIEQLELPTYSPYVAELSGVYMERGQLTTYADAKAEDGALDALIKLEILHPEFSPLSDEDAKRLADKAGVPLETAVSLLQDGDGKVRLKLPVGGTLQDPQIDISGAINKAIGNALKKVFPPTLVFSMLSSMQKGLAGVPSFEPFVFAAGSSELDAGAMGYADELAALLDDKPRLSLQVCGRTTAADLEAVAGPLPAPAAEGDADAEAAAARTRIVQEHEAALRELAVERTRAVRRYLLNEKGIDAKRVGECRTEFNPDDDGPPRAMVSL